MHIFRGQIRCIMGNVEVAHKDGPKFNKNVYTCNLLACVQTYPLPQKKKKSSLLPIFYLREGGRLYTG